LPIQLERAAEAARGGRAPGEQTQAYPLYIWPLETALGDSLYLTNYADHDPTGGIRDYMNGAWAYDTHRGTDLALLDFRVMDRGIRIRAAAPGVVTYVVHGNRRDRNCASPDNPTLNYIEISHGGGTYTYYLHLRAHSAAVNVGESVQTGQVLGLVGSSGYSTGPHLHLEAGEYLPGYYWRDPFTGPANPLPSLWTTQAPWQGAEHLRIFDMGVTTQAAAGGDLDNVDFCTVAYEKMEQPAVFGLDEPYIAVWFSPQGLTGDTFRIEISRPDGSLYAWAEEPLPFDIRGGVYYWYWVWNGHVSPADTGTWTSRMKVSGVTVREVPFSVGALTSFGPRIRPAVSRSFRINGSAQRCTLRVTPLGGPVTYSLLDAPGFVTLTDSVLTVPGVSSQPTRSCYFQVVAVDGAARRDTAWFHLVDPSKPRDALVDAEPALPRLALALTPAGPNPFSGSTTLRFATPSAGRVTLAVLDLGGRRVRTLFDGERAAGGGSATWDGRDERGNPAPAGVYFAWLDAGGQRLARRLVRLP
jgi:hypothetical protein